jgi:two-component system, LytTR family, response regulator
MTCIIIDDETKNLKLLKNMLAIHCTNVQVLAECNTAESALEILKTLQPDVIFLDVEMPEINGFDLLKKLEPVQFEVIFVTAFSQHAVAAFEHQATGFVTKPINSEKLVAAVQAASKRIEEKQVNKNIFSLLEKATQKPSLDKIPLTTTNGLVFVKLTDIQYCESSGNYTNFFVENNKKVVVCRQLGEFERLLPETNFIRIHDKYLINLSYIKAYIKGNGGEVVLDSGIQLPVATRKKETFLAYFETWLKRK